MSHHKIFDMLFAKLYSLYVQKAKKKGRTEDEVQQVITWLTGYSAEGIQACIDNEVSFKQFFDDAPEMNNNRNLITGIVCGVRVENIEDPLMKMGRQLDKIIDELAKGKSMDKILRNST